MVDAKKKRKILNARRGLSHDQTSFSTSDEDNESQQLDENSSRKRGKKVSMSFFLQCCAHFSDSLSRHSKKVLEKNLEFAQENIHKNGQEIAIAVLGRIIESGPGRDRLGAWYLLDVLLKKETTQYPIAKKILPVIQDVIRYRFDIGDDDFGAKYNTLLSSWRALLEPSIYAAWYDATRYAMKHHGEQLALSEEVRRFLFLHKAYVVEQLRRLRQPAKVRWAIGIYEIYGLKFSEKENEPELLETLNQKKALVEAEELRRAHATLKSVRFCANCRVPGHRIGKCPEHFCNLCLSIGHAIENCTTQHKCPYCQQTLHPSLEMKTGKAKLFKHVREGCANQTTFAIETLQKLGFPWKKYVMKQSTLLDEVIKKIRQDRTMEEGLRKDALNQSALILHSFGILRRHGSLEFLEEARDPIMFLVSNPPLCTLTEVEESGTTAMIDVRLTECASNRELLRMLSNRYKQVIENLLFYVAHDSLTTADVEAIETTKRFQLYLGYANPKNAKTFDAYVEALSRQGIRPEQLREALTRTHALSDNLCIHCLSRVHFSTDCPSRVQDELRYDQRLAVNCLTRFGWQTEHQPNLEKWNRKIQQSSDILSPSQTVELSMATSIVTDPLDPVPYCTECRMYRHSESRCHKRALQFLESHDIRLCEILFFPWKVSEMLEKWYDRDKELWERMYTAVELYVPVKEPNAFIVAAELLDACGLKLQTIQYYLSSVERALHHPGLLDVLSGTYLNATGKKLTLPSLKYAFSVVTSSGFPTLCYACGDVGHQVDGCPQPPRYMKHLIQRAREVARHSVQLLERCIRRDTTGAKETMPEDTRRAVEDLFACVQNLRPTAEVLIYGTHHMEDLQEAFFVLRSHGLTWEDVINDDPCVHSLLRTLYHNRSSHLRDVEQALDVLRHCPNRPPFCTHCQHVGHLPTSCPLLQPPPLEPIVRSMDKALEALPLTVDEIYESTPEAVYQIQKNARKTAMKTMSAFPPTLQHAMAAQQALLQENLLQHVCKLDRESVLLSPSSNNTTTTTKEPQCTKRPLLRLPLSLSHYQTAMRELTSHQTLSPSRVILCPWLVLPGLTRLTPPNSESSFSPFFSFFFFFSFSFLKPYPFTFHLIPCPGLFPGPGAGEAAASPLRGPGELPRDLVDPREVCHRQGGGTGGRGDPASGVSRGGAPRKATGV